MKSPLVAATAFLVVAAVTPQLSAAERLVHSWKKMRLTEHFWCEGAYYGDFNKDGKMDVVAGPYWWAGPDFNSRQEYRPATKTWVKKRPDGTEEKVPGFK